jgi:hypothetical protein
MRSWRLKALAVAAVRESLIGPGCVKSGSDAMILRVNRQAEAMHVRLRGGDKNFTEAKMRRRFERIEESVARYLSQLETADLRGDAVPKAKV